jgi:UDP-N-acetylglucosamine:LPS N-acetylglucosamine transferase
MRKMKICLCASSGGHYQELLALKDLAAKHDCFILTERTDFALLPVCGNTYTLPILSRHNWWLFLPFIVAFTKTFYLFLKEKPDCVISAGALATFPAIICAKLMGKKVVYFESLARIHSPSKTGKIAYRIADLFVVQWPSMVQFYPKAIVGCL